MDIFIYSCLAAFAITYLIRYTDGPFGVFYYVRTALGFIQYDDHDETTNWIAEMIECYPCLTTWISFIVLLFATKLNILDTVALWFPCVGVSLVLWKYMTR